MITGSNSDVITKQLEEYSKEVERRLKNMVERFSVEVLEAASDNTRLGDAVKYAALYKLREEAEGWKAEEGMARGGWVVALDGTPAFVERHGKNTTSEAVSQATRDSQGYKLGQNFVIGTAVPYTGIFGLEILHPTMDQVTTVIESNLKKHYEAG